MRRSFVLLAVAAAVSACGFDLVAVEVLPPRTSVTCTAPTVKASALGRGVLDLEGSREATGSYVADLRITSGNDARIDGLQFTYGLPEGASSGTSSKADVASGAPPLGDVVLVGDGNDPRRAVVEDVVLVPRELAVALRDDDGIDADAKVLNTLVVEMQPIVDGRPDPAPKSTFALDLCRGCLVDEPPADECDGTWTKVPVCREGQDVKMWTCVAGAAAGAGGGA